MAAPLSTPDALADLCMDALAPRERRLVGICGPPGSGKSTLSDALCSSLNHRHPGIAEVVPMDGFHYDNGVLDEIGARDRKGAPHTFDVAGFTHVLSRLKENSEPAITIPVFDRDLDLSRGSARRVASQAQILIVEGNYLLLDDMSWKPVRATLWKTIFIDVSRAELERRLLERWADYGWDPERARSWVADNDMPNVDRVLTNSAEPDLRYIQ